MARRLTLALVTACLVGSVFARSAEAVGIGIVVGEPTGLSVKWRETRGGSVQMALAWSFRGEDRLVGTLDYVLGRPFERSEADFYYGLGIAVGATEGGRFGDGDAHLGLRLPIGIEVFPDRAIGVFFELAPGILLTPSSEFELTGGVGARYYF